MGLAETWLYEDDHDLCQLKGYNVIENHSDSLIAGGVAYVYETIYQLHENLIFLFIGHILNWCLLKLIKMEWI